MLGTHPASSGTATCAALCASDSATESWLEIELCMSKLKIFRRSFIFHFNNGVKVRDATVSDEDEILTSVWYQFIHNYGNPFGYGYT